MPCVMKKECEKLTAVNPDNAVWNVAFFDETRKVTDNSCFKQKHCECCLPVGDAWIEYCTGGLV